MPSQETTYGIVYVLTNPAMPDLIKIGMTSRDSMDARLKELYNTSVPFPFECEYACKVTNYQEVEQALHIAFDHNRVNPQREFFKVRPEQVIAILRLFDKGNVTDEVNREIANDTTVTDRVAGQEFKKARRPSLNFRELGIPVGSTLEFTAGEGIITASVAGDKKVVVNGVESSLTAATRDLLGLDYSVQPTPYWNYNGRKLLDIYNDVYVLD